MKSIHSNGNFIVCLTHDVDRIKKTYQYFTHFAKTMDFYHIKSFLSREKPYWNFEKMMKVERKYRVRSTLFFLNESIKFNPFKPKNWKLSLGRYKINEDRVEKIIKKLDVGGWEIGLHGSYNSYKSLELLKKEKKQLEKILGHKVIGIRQHYLNLNENTWKMQSEAGFKYDSSFGFTRGLGWKNKKYKPFRPLKNRKFIVIPLTIMDVCLFNKKNVKNEYMSIIKTAERHGAVLTINWHQSKFNEKECPERIKVYKDIIKECKKRGALFMTLNDLYKNGEKNG